MKLSILTIICALASSVVLAQESTNNNQEKVGTSPIPYMERVSRGFGQLREPRFAGDRPEWLKQEENQKRVQQIQVDINHRGPAVERGPRGPRGPMMGQGRGNGPRGPMQFNKGPRGNRFEKNNCPLCKKHQKQMMKKNKKHNKHQNRGQRGHNR